APAKLGNERAVGLFRHSLARFITRAKFAKRGDFSAAGPAANHIPIRELGLPEAVPCLENSSSVRFVRNCVAAYGSNSCAIRQISLAYANIPAISVQATLDGTPIGLYLELIAGNPGKVCAIVLLRHSKTGHQTCAVYNALWTSNLHLLPQACLVAQQSTAHTPDHHQSGVKGKSAKILFNDRFVSLGVLRHVPGIPQRCTDVAQTT